MTKKNAKKITPILAVIALVVLALILRPWEAGTMDPDPEGTIHASAGETPETLSEPGDSASAESYRFRTQVLLDQHYEKHGIEMGFASAEEYEAAASAVVNNKAALHKLEKEDGDDVYYIEATNEFVVVSVDGYIRTFFLPDAGIDYYNRQ